MDILVEHIYHVRGASKIIYTTPDEIWVTKRQKQQYFNNDDWILALETSISVRVNNDPTN